MFVEKGPTRTLPRHIIAGLGYHSVMMAEELDPDPAHVAFRFQDLPGIAKEDLEYGLTEIVPWWWAAYFRFPLEARKELGRTEDLLSALRDARSLGSNIAPFISIHIISSNQLLAKYGAKPDVSNWTYGQAFVPDSTLSMHTASMGAGLTVAIPLGSTMSRRRN